MSTSPRRAGDCPVCVTPFDPQVMFSREPDAPCRCTADSLERAARYHEEMAQDHRRRARRIRAWATDAPKEVSR